MNRVKTGIKGFDQLVDGGFPKGSCILFAGSPGTGKTIFGMEFLYNGAVKYKEKGLFVSFEQEEQNIINSVRLFGWDMDSLIKKKMMHIMSIPAEEIKSSTAKEIMDFCKKNNIKRLVIDSLTTLSANAPIYTETKDVAVKDLINENTFFSPPIIGDAITRRFIYRFINMLRKIKGITSILISEASEKSEYLSKDGISEFVCDGVILVNFDTMGGDFSRQLIVRKMRDTKNDEDLHPLAITNKGIDVKKIKM